LVASSPIDTHNLFACKDEEIAQIQTRIFAACGRVKMVRYECAYSRDLTCFAYRDPCSGG
jgi:hypothetical protein